jgi:opacity protein-like surface antigen
MKISGKQFGIGGLGSVLALAVLAVALTSGAQASSGYTACPNKTIKITVEGAEGEKPRTFNVKAKAISVDGVTCAAAYEFIRYSYNGEKIGASGYPLHYTCKQGTFSAPVGFLPTQCVKPGKKIRYGAQGG